MRAVIIQMLQQCHGGRCRSWVMTLLLLRWIALLAHVRHGTVLASRVECGCGLCICFPRRNQLAPYLLHSQGLPQTLLSTRDVLCGFFLRYADVALAPDLPPPLPVLLWPLSPQQLQQLLPPVLLQSLLLLSWRLLQRPNDPPHCFLGDSLGHFPKTALC